MWDGEHNGASAAYGEEIRGRVFGGYTLYLFLRNFLRCSWGVNCYDLGDNN